MNKALFLDRDGIINIDYGYVHTIDKFEFTTDIFELCYYAQSLGYLLIVVTNQSGIARGKYTVDQFKELTQWMKEQFKQNDIQINSVYYCPHHPTQGSGEFLKICDCRKPRPGMILTAASEHNIDLSTSVFIGDRISDMSAAKLANINKRLLLSKTNKEPLESELFLRVPTIMDAKSYL